MLACAAGLAVLAVPASAQVAPVESVPAATPLYRIGPGDDIAVTFPYNPELDHGGPVGPDGQFSMPLVGNVPVGGRTLDEVAAIISADLSRRGVVDNAQPTVGVRQYGGVVYVGGEVRTPGPVKLVSAMDPLQAVIVAGGMLETARSKQIVVIHRNADGTIVQRHADLRAYAHKGLPTGIGLQSQDIVFVPRSSIAEADLWVDQHINRLLPFSRSLNYSIGNNAVVTR